ncbi:MAG: hypothetical protein ACM3U2_14555 [Deltaproteobacteria bacterium]
MLAVDTAICLTTYSTLASTLARAFGFLVAVVLYVMPLTVFFLKPTSPIAVSMLTLTIVCAMFCIRGYFRLIQAVLPA